MEKVKPFVEVEEELPLQGRKSSRKTTVISAGTNAGVLIGSQYCTTTAISAGTNAGVLIAGTNAGVLIGSQYSFKGDHNREVESNLYKNGGNEHSDVLFASKNPTVGDITNSETENLPAISSLQVPFSAKPHEERIEHATPDTGTSQNGNISLIKEIEPDVAEVYLEEVIKKPNTREFYCPHCDTCIQKVMLRDTEQEHTSAHCLERIRCTSCFSFLVPAECWPFSKPSEANKDNQDLPQGPPQQSSTTKKPPSSVTKLDDGSASAFEEPPPPAASGGAYLTVPQKPDLDSPAVAKPDSTQPLKGIVIDGGKPSTDSKKEEPAGTSEKETPQTKSALHDITRTTSITESRSDYKLEIVKSIVYGGLIESITSLSVVTSAASAGATPLKIVALALANLIGGLFVMGQNLWELRSDEPAETSRYHVLLGNRDNFAIHIPVAVLSYLVFGLIPPVVYGFSFQKSNNTDFKLLAVAAASLICITILAIGKAHIQNPQKYSVYFTTILHYVLIGAMASGISYVAGDLIKKVMEKFGWLKSVAVTTPLPEMDSGTLSWASY
ncbi:hypothetical protein K2173_018489 [Erythroxylum novogranatense]|uniref:Membrane protein of ER body-like protein n=1 Tax=Erythroxylum novogranatense TaxID=1862640 RepID=A0AAV8UAE5_9ROSI|nr:hypothetical protein K2173_018489 [Erythroxylum novogranatense]